MRDCISHHHACDCRERHFAKMEIEYRALQLRWIELRQSSKGTILNEDGDPMYALVPLHVLNDQ